MVIAIMAPAHNHGMVMTCSAVAAHLFGLSRRNIAIAPSFFLAVVPARRARRSMAAEHDVVIVPVVVAVVMKDATVIAITVMMPYIVAVVVPFLVALGKGWSAESKGKSQKQYQAQPVHSTSKNPLAAVKLVRLNYWPK
jgi:hypothetical protein